MKKFLLILLLCPLALFAQKSSWDVSPLGNGDTPQAENANKPEESSVESLDGERFGEPVEYEDSEDEIAPRAVQQDEVVRVVSQSGNLVEVRSGYESVDSTQYGKSGYPLIMPISEKGWLGNVKYAVKGDYAKADDFEYLLNMNSKAAAEVQSSKSWTAPYFLGLLVATVGVSVSLCVSNEKVKTGFLLGGVAGFGLDLYSARQSNEHLNNAVDIYNREGPDSEKWNQ